MINASTQCSVSEETLLKTTIIIVLFHTLTIGCLDDAFISVKLCRYFSFINPISYEAYSNILTCLVPLHVGNEEGVAGHTHHCIINNYCRCIFFSLTFLKLAAIAIVVVTILILAHHYFLRRAENNTLVVKKEPDFIIIGARGEEMRPDQHTGLSPPSC